MPDFSPWYCSSCAQMVPVSSLTHWIDLNALAPQHSVHPPGSAPVTRPEHALGTRVPSQPPRVKVFAQPDGDASLYVETVDGQVLARVDVRSPRHVNGSPLPELFERLQVALELAYYDQIDY